MRSHAFLLAVGFLPFVCNAAVPADLPALDSWVAIKPFAAESEQMSCANSQIDKEWEVTAELGAIQVRRVDRTRPPEKPPVELPNNPEFDDARHFLKADGGYFVGLDRGEFGGGLWWLPASEPKYDRISGENVHGLFRDGSRIVALVGLAHLTMDDGAVLEISQEKGAWKVNRTLALGSAPETWTMTPEGAVVVTGSGISRYRNGTLTRLHKSDYGQLYPSSVVVVDDGTIFIGMRYAVARLTPSRNGFKESWLVLPSCVKMRRVDLGACECLPSSGDRLR